MNGPSTQSYPSLTATIRAEVIDATGPRRRSHREALAVLLLGLSVGLIPVLVVALALVR